MSFWINWNSLGFGLGIFWIRNFLDLEALDLEKAVDLEIVRFKRVFDLKKFSI